MCREKVHGVLDMCGVIEPIGVVCDGFNALLYFFSGDYTNGSLSLTAVFPIIGQMAGSTKILTKISKTAAGSPAGVYYKTLLKPGTNLLHWVGGESKLARVMRKAGGSHPDLVLDAAAASKR